DGDSITEGNIANLERVEQVHRAWMIAARVRKQESLSLLLLCKSRCHNDFEFREHLPSFCRPEHCNDDGITSCENFDSYIRGNFPVRALGCSSGALLLRSEESSCG